MLVPIIYILNAGYASSNFNFQLDGISIPSEKTGRGSGTWFFLSQKGKIKPQRRAGVFEIGSDKVASTHRNPNIHFRWSSFQSRKGVGSEETSSNTKYITLIPVERSLSPSLPVWVKDLGWGPTPFGTSRREMKTPAPRWRKNIVSHGIVKKAENGILFPLGNRRWMFRPGNKRFQWGLWMDPI